MTPAEPPPEPPTESQPVPAAQTLPGGPSAEPSQPLSPDPNKKRKRTPSPSSSSSSSSPATKKNCPVKLEDEAEGKKKEDAE